MVHKNTHIPLIATRLTNNMPGINTVYFKRPLGFYFEAGDWIDVNFTGSDYRGGKTYSLSSSPTEDELAITFRDGISPLKCKLQAVEVGEKLFISQYGNDYGFHLKDNRKTVLIAGGIGIAPFRSMLKEMADTANRDLIQLIYLNKGSSFLFQDEIEQWEQSLNLEVHYIDTEIQKRKQRNKIIENNLHLDSHYYFIAGPEGMVESTEHLLIDMGVNVKDIRIDSFGGY